MSASTHPLDRLETTDRTISHAQYEAFEFELVEQSVLVRNASHANLEDHEYLVTIDAGGLPSSSECPADDHQPGACKHLIAVAIRTPVFEIAIVAQTVRELSGRAGRKPTTVV